MNPRPSPLAIRHRPILRWVILSLLCITWSSTGVARLSAATPAPQPRAMSPATLATWSTSGLTRAPAALTSGARPDAQLARDTHLPAWRAEPRDGWQLIDDFDSASWPRSSDWPLVADLNAPFVGRDGYPWAPSPCESTPGTRTLRAVGGGDGATLDCDAAYPSAIASSALLSLDLSQLSGARLAQLRFDLWVEADPDEGMLVQLLRFGDDGQVLERRLVYSATGRVATWARGQAIDLTGLRDARDPSWRHDLRGERAFLEFLFVSTDGGDGGARGVLLDNVGIDVTLAAPTAQPSLTPTPAPGTPGTAPTATPDPGVERTNLCTDIRNCSSLSVRAWVDRGCDGRNQVGHDAPLGGEPHVAVRVGEAAQAQMLGTSLSRSGRATFAFPPNDSLEVSLVLPAGYTMCPASENPRQLGSKDFNRYGRASLDFRVQRSR